jgi:pheromone a factor receptor
MVLACMDVVFTLPLSIVLLHHALSNYDLTPWPGWAVVHSGFSYVGQVPAAVWSADVWLEFSVRWNQWASVFCAVVFIGFFGFAQDVREGYWNFYVALMRKVGVEIVDNRKKVVLPPIHFAQGQTTTQRCA